MKQTTQALIFIALGILMFFQGITNTEDSGTLLPNEGRIITGVLGFFMGIWLFYKARKNSN